MFADVVDVIVVVVVAVFVAVVVLTVNVNIHRSGSRNYVLGACKNTVTC